jgi:hypothetical protein
MLQVPPWRFAPFGVPAAFDVNLCTDSVLPGSVAPGPVTLRLGFVATSLRIPWSLLVPEYWMGPFPALTTPRNSILTGPEMPFWPAVPSFEGSISCVCGPGNPWPKAPAITAEDPFAPPACGDAPGISAKRLCCASLAFVQGLARPHRRAPRLSITLFPKTQSRKTPCDLRQRDPNSQTGACEHSSQYPAPGR